jgi:hypothetical protein
MVFVEMELLEMMSTDVDYLQIQSNLLLFYFCFSDSSTSHKFENIVMRNNEDGAIFYQNIGEINPSIYFDRCWIEGNGIAILNLSIGPVRENIICDVGL